jgi:CRISPR-associated endonuclease Cas2
MPYCVVAYDIPDDRRRLRLSRVLWGMLDRVQKSVFEGELEEHQVDRLEAGDASGASAHPPSGRTRTFG